MENKLVKKQPKQVEFALRIQKAHKKGRVFLTQDGIKHVESLVKGK